MASLAFAIPGQAPLRRVRRTHAPTCTQRQRFYPPRCTAIAPRPTTSRALIEEFWSLSRTGSFSSTAYLFSLSAVYVDTLYASPFAGLPAITRHLTDMESAIPPGLVFVLDDLAPAETSVGARWHVETRGGKQLPFSRGASMYKVEMASDERGGVWITEAWDFVETPFKVAGVVLPVLRALSFLLRSSGSGSK